MTNNGQLEVTTPLGSAKIFGTNTIGWILIGVNIGATLYIGHELQDKITALKEVVNQNRTIVCMLNDLSPKLAVYCQHLLETGKEK